MPGVSLGRRVSSFTQKTLLYVMLETTLPRLGNKTPQTEAIGGGANGLAERRLRTCWERSQYFVHKDVPVEY